MHHLDLLLLRHSISRLAVGQQSVFVEVFSDKMEVVKQLFYIKLNKMSLNTDSRNSAVQMFTAQSQITIKTTSGVQGSPVTIYT